MKVSGCVLSLAAANAVGATVIPQFVQEFFSNQEAPDVLRELLESESDDSFRASLWPHLPYFLKPALDTKKLQEAIEIDQLNHTAWDLYECANASTKEYGHPTRVIGSAGHWKTVQYILSELDDHKDYYEISLQSFPALSGKLNSYNLSFASGKKVPSAKPLALTPSVKGFFGKVIEIPNLGCDEIDYKTLSVPKNGIALIERGQCSFAKKSELAGRHGFKAAIIYDNDPKSTDGIKGSLDKVGKHTVATIGLSYKEGKKLVADLELHKGEFSLYYEVDSVVKKIKTKNIIVDTKHGDPDNVIVLGAHSDSVAAGPGINDDGSGAIALLTVAKELTRYKINNKVRFAWWSAEEEGLLGSTHYIDHLSATENSKIRLFLDYDMLASPNYEYQVYDANNKDHPAGSKEIKKLYTEYYTSKNLTYSLIPFDGRSDYVGFINHGIPSGGIATGADGINENNGLPFDECYHSLCDDVSNLAFDAFLVNTRLIAHSVATFAKSLEDFPLRTNGTVVQPHDFMYKGSNLIL